MTGSTPAVIETDSVAGAWAQAMSKVLDAPNGAAPPLLVCIRGGDESLPPTGHPAVDAVDAHLETLKRPLTMDTAATIFPHRSWVHSGRLDATDFGDRSVTRIFPRIKARMRLRRRTCYGTYFQRLVAYPDETSGSMSSVNQLAYVVGQMKLDKRFRESGLQMSILHPVSDNTRQPQRGFPCLQQIGVSWLDEDDGFALNAFYPTQHLVYRALGNYVGLTQLGGFIADQTCREFRQLNCYVGSPSISAVRKDAVRGLIASVTADPTHETEGEA